MRKLTGLLLVVAMVGGGAATATADHGEDIEGLWVSTDLDGSDQMLRLTEEADGTFSIGLIDFLATVACEPEAFFRSGGNGVYDDTTNEFTGTLTNPVCAKNASPTFTTFPFTAEFDPATNTLTDFTGVTWTRR